MAIITFDRTKEYSTSTGTGNLNFAGAVVSFQAFGTNYTNGQQFPYVIVGTNTNVWEVGIGTYISVSNSFQRTQVTANSSGTTSPLNLSADTYQIGVDVINFLISHTLIDIVNLPSNSVLEWNGTDIVAGTAISGISGNIGISGISGNIGISGTLGNSGVSGNSGLSGISGGVSGLSGISGGISGISGISGLSGQSGNSGNSGQSGISGLSGRSGISGISGQTATSGISGDSGQSGLSGISGILGNSGTSGLSGISGGISGLSGISGIIGGTGTQGISGQSGNSGLSGISGLTSISGQSGLSGQSGISGNLGVTTFSVGGTIVSPTGSVTYIAFNAPFNCTLRNMYGWVGGDINSTINAIHNSVSSVLQNNFTLSAANTWLSCTGLFGSPTASFVSGDSLQVEVTSVSGSPTQIGIQLNFTQP